MTTQQTTQIPESLQAAMAEWGRHETRKAQIDGDLSQLDVRIGEYTKALTDLKEAHVALGRDRTQVEAEADFARGMVEHGCQRLGIEMPSAPAVPQQAPPVPPAAPAPLPVGVEPVSPEQAVQALTGLSTGTPLETVTDPGPVDSRPQDGDQPVSDTGSFQPESADSRRRRGGRRGGA